MAKMTKSQTGAAIALGVLILVGGGLWYNASTPETPQPNDTTAATAATTGKFSVTLKISASQDVYTSEGAPKPEEVEAALKAALYKTEAFEEGGPRALKGLVNYDIKSLPNDGGHDIVLLGSLNSPGANFDAGVNVQATDEAWKGKSLREMVDGAVAQFAGRIGAQARVIGGDDANLRTILESSTETEDLRLMAIQEIRERRLKQHLDVVRGYLDPAQPPTLRLAASAALVSMDDKASASEILTVAEDFSRDRNPQFVPMLHILSDLGGTEIITYLEAVAEAHSAPAVRTVAQEALDKARGGAARP